MIQSSDEINNHLDAIQSAWKGHREFANRLVRHMQPQVTVELGVDLGFSSFAMCLDNPGTVYGIDTFEGDDHAGLKSDAYERMMQVKEQHGFDNLEIIRGTFKEAAASWDRPVDILHIDGFHSVEAVQEDFDTWSPFLREGGVVLLHDTGAHEGPRVLYEGSDWPKLNFAHSAGLGVMSRDAALIETIRDWFLGDPNLEQ